MAQNPFYVDPGNDYSSGLSGLSNTMLNIRQNQIANAEQKRRQEKEDRAQKRFEEVQSAAQEAFGSQDPDKVAKIAIKYPEITPMLQQVTGLQTDMQNREALGFTRALATASPESRPALYEQRIKSILDRGGDPSHTVQSYKEYQQDPESELRDVTSFWAGIAPKEYTAYSDQQKAAQAAAIEKQKAAAEESRFQRGEAGKNSRAYARAASTAGGSAGDKRTAHQKDYEQYQQLKKEDPTGAKEYGMAAGFVGKEGRELSPQAQKRLSVAIDDTVSAERNVGKFEQLASDIEKSDFTPGVAGTLGEKFKELTGEQDAISNLRREYNAIKGSQVVSNLPPGAASDKDIEMAMAGFPSDRANKQQLAGFLRGLAKVQKLNADFSSFKADHISDTGSERGMLQAWKQRPADSRSSALSKPPGAASDDGWEIVN